METHLRRGQDTGDVLGIVLEDPAAPRPEHQAPVAMMRRHAEDLVRAAEVLAGAGLVTLHEEFAAATPALLAREAEFRGRLQQAFALTKPTFNEDMRGGHTNM